MTPFYDSSAILADATALRARMAEDGYLFLPGLLPATDVMKVRRQMLACIAGAGWLRRDTPAESGIADLEHFTVEPEARFMAVFNQQFALRDLQALQQHPALMSLFARLFDAPVLAHPRFVIRNIFPGKDAYTTPAHQDYVHFQGSVACCAAWIPIGDCDAVMGGLQVAAGSHKSGLHDVRPTLGAGALEVADPLRGRWHYNPFRAGDVLIHNCLTVHKGVPNRSEALRLSIDARYQPVSEPIVEDSLFPHRRFTDWREVYAGWKADDPLKYYWRKFDLDIVPFDFSLYEQRDQLAFAMADNGDGKARGALQRILVSDPRLERREKAEVALAKLDAADALPPTPISTT